MENNLPPIAIYYRSKRLAMRLLESGQLKLAAKAMLEAKKAQIDMINQQARALLSEIDNLNKC